MSRTIARARSETGDPLLLTPGPLTTALSVKEVMLHDWGARDSTFISINNFILKRVTEIANGGTKYVTVPIQGSGSFGVEAMLTTFVPSTGRVLILINGQYGERAKRICKIANRKYTVYRTPEDKIPDFEAVQRVLKRVPSITHIFLVHCETTSGILNPLEEIAELARTYRKRLLIDAISSFGAIPLDARVLNFDALVASPNKCLEAIPGVAFVVCRNESLKKTKGNATTLVLDLHDQWRNFAKTDQYRFTPPIHVIVSLSQALQEFAREGGAAGRLGRYQENCRLLVRGMRILGFEPFLPDCLQGPMVVTFRMPTAARFVFSTFYNNLKERGFIIYPGKLKVAKSFQIGCMGHLYPEDMRNLLVAVRETLTEMKVALASAVSEASET
jgi:2-aminoethylphosphonate-pyruvate transaminase